MLVTAQHIGRGDPRLLLGQSPVFDAQVLVVQRERCDIASRPETVGHAHCAIDMQRVILLLR
ncbi:hypothetical protein D3C84_511660 [compost metagenome]